MTAILIKDTQFGRRAVPVARDEAESLVESGKAKKLSKCLYEMKPVKKPIQKSEKVTVTETKETEASSDYDTKVMEPKPTTKRRRGRPKKSVEDE